MGETLVDYTKLMRKSTREVHSISDALINAKIALTSSNNEVWAEGLLIFYEIFKFIETAIKKTQNEHLQKFNIPEIFRTAAFEEDLDFYLTDWRVGYIPRQSVRRYLNYLGKLERNEPELLIAYFYHLYMGLLSGGQILRKKRMLLSKVYLDIENGKKGNAVTEFTESTVELKQKIRKLVNEACAEINPEMRDKIIKEGQMVFRLNNEIVGSISGSNFVLFKKIIVAGSIAAVAYILYKVLLK